VYGSLVPLLYHPVEWADAVEKFRNLPPLWTGMGTRADWVANILLFIPLTFLWMGALTCDRGRIAKTLAAVALSAIASAGAFALEFTQIWFSGRTVSRNDILAETIGGCLGVILWLSVGGRVVRWLRGYAAARESRPALEWLLGAYVLGFAIYSVIPLDLTISLTELYGKYKRGAVLLVPFSYNYESPITVVYQFFADIATFVPVGAWVALVRPSRIPVRSPFLIGLIGGGTVAVAMEIAQFLVLSRYTDTTDILLGSLGAGLGAWITLRAAVQPRSQAAAAPRRRARTAIIWIAVLFGYSIFLIAGFGYPFDITGDRAILRTRYEGFFRVPFMALYQGSEFNAIKQFLVRILLFTPLGVITAYLAAMLRSSVARFFVVTAGLAYALAIAVGIEVAQIFMPSKIADSTEVAICFVGAVLGLIAARRIVNRTVPGGVPSSGLPTGVAGAPAAGRNRSPR
jgi:glycopeptide antibiotics resistance protein